jgi:hypothetical protein
MLHIRVRCETVRGVGQQRVQHDLARALHAPLRVQHLRRALVRRGLQIGQKGALPHALQHHLQKRG